MVRDALSILRELLATEVVEKLPEPDEHGSRYRLTIDLQENFALNSPLSPFALAAPMIAHLLGRLDVAYCALLLKATFFHAEERRALFHRTPPARIHALTWRLDFKNQGAPVMECAWFVWHRGWPKGEGAGTHYHLLPKPGREQGAML